MSEPQQPPVPPYGQPSPSPQGSPQPAAQPYSQPQQPAQPYAPQPYPGQSYPAAAPRPAASGAALGRTALIIALIAFGIGLLGTLLYPLVYGLAGFSYGFGFSLVNGVTTFLVVVGSAIALVLGLIAIRRPGPHVLAGIAIGVAAGEVAASVISWISSLFYLFV